MNARPHVAIQHPGPTIRNKRLLREDPPCANAARRVARTAEDPARARAFLLRACSSKLREAEQIM